MSRKVYLIIGTIEMLIGLFTISFLVSGKLGFLRGFPEKPLNIYIFVIVSAVISFALGAGLICMKEWARVLLVFFSGYIIIQKVLLFAGLLALNWETAVFVPAGIKNIISLFYHFVILVSLLIFRRRPVNI
ncbi:MAG: hypothetical protein GF408_00205 [Candidatus Omnitrophica bacterium]|nr:hypothetical protein [Candidatus Omnitrophota bacterium]